MTSYSKTTRRAVCVDGRVVPIVPSRLGSAIDNTTNDRIRELNQRQKQLVDTQREWARITLEHQRGYEEPSFQIDHTLVERRAKQILDLVNDKARETDVFTKKIPPKPYAHHQHPKQQQIPTAQPETNNHEIHPEIPAPVLEISSPTPQCELSVVSSEYKYIGFPQQFRRTKPNGSFGPDNIGTQEYTGTQHLSVKERSLDMRSDLSSSASIKSTASQRLISDLVTSRQSNTYEESELVHDYSMESSQPIQPKSVTSVVELQDVSLSKVIQSATSELDSATQAGSDSDVQVIKNKSSQNVSFQDHSITLNIKQPCNDTKLEDEEAGQSRIELSTSMEADETSAQEKVEKTEATPEPEPEKEEAEQEKTKEEEKSESDKYIDDKMATKPETETEPELCVTNKANSKTESTTESVPENNTKPELETKIEPELHHSMEESPASIETSAIDENDYVEDNSRSYSPQEDQYSSSLSEETEPVSGEYEDNIEEYEVSEAESQYEGEEGQYFEEEQESNSEQTPSK